MYGYTLSGRNYYIFNYRREAEEDIEYYMLKCSENAEHQIIYPLNDPFHCQYMKGEIIVHIFAKNRCGMISAKPKKVPLPIMNSKKREFYGSRLVDHFISCIS